MLINIINHHAEQTLLARLEQGSEYKTVRGALYFDCNGITPPPSEEELIIAFRPELSDRRGALYLFQDGDVVVTWNGAQKSILDALCKCFYDSFDHKQPSNRHRYFDMQAHGEDLRLLCKRKLAALAKKPDDNAPTTHAIDSDTGPPFELSPDQIRQFTLANAARKYRKEPEILVVEDQSFSKKLLCGLLRRQYEVYDAISAEKALEIYFAYAPDIVFLDIELPGMSGHRFTEAVCQIDPASFIIMVSANNYMEDVIRAKKNGVKSFVVKPYSKHKIMEGVEKFLQQRK